MRPGSDRLIGHENSAKSVINDHLPRLLKSTEEDFAGFLNIIEFMLMVFSVLR